jgi:hypothetical protein
VDGHEEGSPCPGEEEGAEETAAQGDEKEAEIAADFVVSNKYR